MNETSLYMNNKVVDEIERWIDLQKLEAKYQSKIECTGAFVIVPVPVLDGTDTGQERYQGNLSEVICYVQKTFPACTMNAFHGYFIKKHIHYDSNPFDALSSIKFEQITKGRLGANVIKCKSADHVPIIRTTTPYQQPAQIINANYTDLLRRLHDSFNHAKDFNNAMVEVYDNSYRNMKFHTDQAQDMDPKSYICLFSCYDDPNTNNLRRLVVKSKLYDDEFSVILEHNSAVFFSVENNDKFVHKIVLNNSNGVPTKWLGVTLRASKTYVTFKDGVPYLDTQPLRMAKGDEVNQVRHCKRVENTTIGSKYPELDFTLSPGDLLPPILLVPYSLPHSY